MIHVDISLELRRRKMKQDDVAATLKMSRISLNRYLNGHTQINARNFVNLIALLGWEIKRDTLTK